MKKLEDIRSWVVKFCVWHIKKPICQFIFVKLANDKELNNVLSSLTLIQTQRNFNSVIAERDSD
jgi:hypothetical protein